jgi:hypothetical protein
MVVISVVVLAVAALIWVAAGYQRPVHEVGPRGADLAMYARLIERMRHGEEYYVAAHAELVGTGYGIRSVFNWRLPTLSWIASGLPSQLWASVLLGIVALGAAGAALKLADRNDRATAFVAAPLLAINLTACVASDATLLTEIFAGFLILASIAAYGLERPMIGVATAIAALFMRELAAPYVVICVALAWRERRHAELGAWLTGLAAFAAFFAFHYLSVQAQLGPLDPADRQGWVQFGGPGFILGTASFNGLLTLAPIWVTAILLPPFLLGLFAWQGPGSARGQLTVAAYLVSFMVVGKPFNGYWGALYMPTLMLGAAFLPAALSDLVTAIRSAKPIHPDRIKGSSVA